MNDLKNIIMQAQNDNEEMMLFLIEKFQPLLNSISNRANDKEDIKSELTLAFIEMIRNINLAKFRNEINDYILTAYIKKSIYRKYIKIQKKEQTKYNNEISTDNENIPDIGLVQTDFEEKILLSESMKSLLTTKEYNCIEKIVLYNYSASELAKENKSSKQAINQCKLRALNKLKLNYQK